MFNLFITSITMKKLFLLFSLIIITSCSTSDDDKIEATNYFNPPAWIQGVWKEPNSGATFTFSNDNVICRLNDHKVNFKENADDLKKMGAYVNVQETIKNDTYTANFQYEDESLLLSFTKTSNTEIESEAYLQGTFIKQ